VVFVVLGGGGGGGVVVGVLVWLGGGGGFVVVCLGWLGFCCCGVGGGVFWGGGGWGGGGGGFFFVLGLGWGGLGWGGGVVLGFRLTHYLIKATKILHIRQKDTRTPEKNLEESPFKGRMTWETKEQTNLTRPVLEPGPGGVEEQRQNEREQYLE